MSRPSLVVVTPWYPTAERPYEGVFVREAVAALRRPADDVLLVHLHNVPPDRAGPPERTTTPDAVVLRVPVPVPPRTSRAEVARRQRRALAAADVRELGEADVVHVHVGMPAGWAVAGLVAPTARLVVTEHATYLPDVLAQPETARMYGELLGRADRLLTVGEDEARTLRRRYPATADRVRSAGNPVRLTRFASRPRVPGRLDRWVFVGNLVARKGVDHLLRGFAAWTAAHPDRADASVTLVGDGPERVALAGLARELGVEGRVRFHGPAEPDDLPALLAEHDVLVHLSDYETFGLTVVEAALTGTPVVVTECGGPEETLSHAAAAGLVRFVPARPGPDVVARAVDALEDTASSADRAAVRAVLADRYGDEAFGRRLGRELAGEPEAARSRPAEVLGVVTSAGTGRRVARVHRHVLRAGGRATLVTDRRGEAEACDRRVAVVDLWPGLAGAPHHGLAAVVLRSVPAALRAARAAAAAAARLPGPAGRLARRGVTVLSRAATRQERAADDAHERVRRRFGDRLDRARLVRLVDARRAELGRPTLVVADTSATGDALLARVRELLSDVPVVDVRDETAVLEVIRRADHGGA